MALVKCLKRLLGLRESPAVTRQSQPPRVKPRQSQPPRVETRQSQPPRVEPRQSQPSRVETRESQPPRVEPRQSQPPRVETREIQPPRVEPRQSQPPRVETRENQPPRVEPRQSQPPRVEPRQSQPPRVEKFQNPPSGVETFQIDESPASTMENNHHDEYGASPATKEDILEVCSEVLSSSLQPQYDSFRDEFKELVQQNQTHINRFVATVREFFLTKQENASLRGEIAKLKEEVSEEKRLHQKLKEKYTTATKDLNARLQQHREKVVQYERDLQTMQNTVSSLKEDKQKLTNDLKKMTQAPCHRPQCKQKIEQLQRDLNKLKPMEVMYHQHDGQNEQLSRDYDELMKAGRGDSVLHLLEKQFNDPFDAKQVLSSLFVGAYDHSKEYLFRCLHEQLDQLYVVQEDEAKHAELENLSSAFGLLLHHTGARTQLKPPAVQYVRKQLKDILPTLEPCSRAKRNLAEVELPLDKVAEVAWKFVTVPNPVIVMELEEYCGEQFQTRQYGKWKDGCEDYTLVYGRPLVYRSYHGIVMHRALVGQKTK